MWRGSERRESTWWIPAREQKEMHRVGLAVVQLTRSTFAEATAGRESLQPSALRARCTRKSSSSFRDCQACPGEIVANTDKSSISPIITIGQCVPHRHSTQKCTETGAPSSGLPTDLRRSDCLSESHRPPALRPRCTRDTRASRRCRQAASKHNCRSLRDSLYNADILALSPVCSTCMGPRIRRAGCAFVHFPG